MSLIPNHCMSGVYLGFGHDGTGANNAQGITGLTAKLAGKAPEVILVGCSLTGAGVAARLALATGVTAHMVMHYPLVPPGGSLAAANAGSYDALWAQAAADIVASPFNTSQLTIGLGWEGGASGYSGGFAWSIGSNGDTSKAGSFATAFARCVTKFRAAGVSNAVTWDWNVMAQQVTTAQLTAAYPGDAYVDVIGWDCYAGNHVGTTNRTRTNYQAIWDLDQLPSLLTIEAFARQHGKRVGAGEFGMIQPVTGNTASNAYVYQAADTALYYQLMGAHITANADVWAYTILFNQNVTSGGTITEDDQLFYCGYDPVLANYPAWTSPNVTNGTWYDTKSAQHVLDLPAFKAYHAASMDFPGAVSVASLQAQVAQLTTTNTTLQTSNASLTAANATLTTANATLTSQLAGASSATLVQLLQQTAVVNTANQTAAQSALDSATASVTSSKAIVDDQASRIARINAAIAAVS